MINKGDFVQWEPNGVVMLKELGYVNKLSECGEYAFVVGSQTGLPVKELRIVDHFYRVMVDYPGSRSPELHRFETNDMVNEFLKTKFQRPDDYALIFNAVAKTRLPVSLNEAEVAFLDSHHFYRRTKFNIAMRDHLNTPSDLIDHFRKLYKNN